MNKLKAFLGLIRLPNLFYIVLTQLLVFLCLSQSTSLNKAYFQLSLLVISSVSLAAAGYIINDYFDVKADELNKPHKIYVNRVFSRRRVMMWHILLNILGLSLGVYLAHLAHNVYFFGIHLLIWLSLWYYSVSLKRKPFIGNLVVALITASVVWIIPLFLPQVAFNIKYIYGYTLFAFLINLQREIVKDLEDIEGDKLIDCKTLPIVLGIKKTKWIATTINLCSIVILLFFMIDKWQINQFNVLQMSIIFAFFAIILPLLRIIIQLKNADSPKHYQLISNALKLIMLVGIILLIILKFEGVA